MEGQYIFNNLTIISEPGQNASLLFNLNFVELYDSGYDFQSSIEISIRVQPCSIGEEWRSDNKCLKCPIGSYLFEQATKAGTIC